MHVNADRSRGARGQEDRVEERDEGNVTPFDREIELNREKRKSNNSK